MVHVWQAWGMLEQRFGDFHQARKLFRSAIWSSNNSTDACKVWQVHYFFLVPIKSTPLLQHNPF